MKHLINKNIFLYIFFLIFSFFIINSWSYTMPDDGWRHLAMSLYPNEIKSWGNVYPNSLYSSYDPWFMWHKLISFLHKFINTNHLIIVINTIIYSLLSLWYYIVLKRYTQLNKILIIIFSFLLPTLNSRYYFLRPDVLSGLFILYFIILEKKFLLYFVSIIYAPFYYIFWFFFGYITYISFILKEYKKIFTLFIAFIIGTIFHISYDYEGFIKTTKLILYNDNLIQSFTVGESLPFILPLNIKVYLGSSFTLLILILFSLILFYLFRPKDHLLKLIILFLPLYISQYRFLNLLEPIIFCFVIHFVYKSYKIIEEQGFNSFIQIITIYLRQNTYFFKINKFFFKSIFLAILLLLFLVIYIDRSKQYQKINNKYSEMSFIKEMEFRNKTILFTSLQTENYIALIHNPSGRYTPSCSLGWVNYNQKNKKTYFDLLINNQTISMDDFFDFLHFINPDYLFIDTQKSFNLKFSNKKIEKEGYEFYKIINSKLIFRKNK